MSPAQHLVPPVSGKAFDAFPKTYPHPAPSTHMPTGAHLRDASSVSRRQYSCLVFLEFKVFCPACKERCPSERETVPVTLAGTEVSPLRRVMPLLSDRVANPGVPCSAPKYSLSGTKSRDHCSFPPLSRPLKTNFSGENFKLLFPQTLISCLKNCTYIIEERKEGNIV